jgi:hypothetical protein
VVGRTSSLTLPHRPPLAALLAAGCPGDADEPPGLRIVPRTRSLTLGQAARPRGAGLLLRGGPSAGGPAPSSSRSSGGGFTHIDDVLRALLPPDSPEKLPGAFARAPPDADGCFSGCAMVDEDGTPVLLYTGVK